MFISIIFEDKKEVPENNNFVIQNYLLEDTIGTIRLSIPIEKYILKEFNNKGSSIIPSGLISFYKNRQDENVSNNIAIFYYKYHNEVCKMSVLEEYIDEDSMMTSRYFPEINFDKDYKNCTINHLKKLNMISRKFK